jgi:hypothetical protein
MKSINNNQQHLLILLVTSLLAILLVFLNSCEKEPTQKIECSCYEVHEYKDYNAQLEQVMWMSEYNTTPQTDLCSKDNGQWIYTGSVSQFRHKTICK